MYKIKRYNVMHDLELLLIEENNRSLMERVVNEVYCSALEIIVKSLNDSGVDDYTNKTVKLIDRVDKQFRESTVHTHIRMRCFEYIVTMAEHIRFYFIQLGCPTYVKYRLDFSPGYYQSATDVIRIDFVATAKCMFDEGQLDLNNEIRPGEAVEMNPSLEALNAYYETVNK